MHGKAKYVRSKRKMRLDAFAVNAIEDTVKKNLCLIAEHKANTTILPWRTLLRQGTASSVILCLAVASTWNAARDFVSARCFSGRQPPPVTLILHIASPGVFRFPHLYLYALFNYHLPSAAVTVTYYLLQLPSPVTCFRSRHPPPGAVTTICHLLSLPSPIIYCSYNHLSPTALVITCHVLPLPTSLTCCRYYHLQSRAPPFTAVLFYL